MSVVVFNEAKFRECCPEVKATLPQLKMWFKQAGSLVNNTDCSIITDLEEREMLLFLLIEHLNALYERAAQSGIVGRIASASEGSVSVSADMGAGSHFSAWYMQTPHGASYWALTAKYREFRYVPGGWYARR